MGRITKERDERRNELIETAQRLFIRQGYDQTAVSHIVGELQVAQGTFYYHFRSKAEVLQAIVERKIAELVRALQAIAEREDLGPASKLEAMFNALLGIHHEHDRLISAIHQDGNIVLHDKLMRMTISAMTPIAAEVIARGGESGAFRVDFPTETAHVLISTLTAVLHQPELMDDAARRDRVRITLERLAARLLGVGDESFRLHV